MDRVSALATADLTKAETARYIALLDRIVGALQASDAEGEG